MSLEKLRDGGGGNRLGDPQLIEVPDVRQRRRPDHPTGLDCANLICGQLEAAPQEPDHARQYELIVLNRLCRRHYRVSTAALAAGSSIT